MEEHRAAASRSVNAAIITCSTSRYNLKREGGIVRDQSGDLIESLLTGAGHRVTSRVLVPDSQRDLIREINRVAKKKDVDSIIVCGGTGITRKDVTIEVAERLMEKEVPGFGELFRSLSYDRVGSAAILTRATSGVVLGKILFCLPGSIEAVQLAMDRLILPEMPHMVKHALE